VEQSLVDRPYAIPSLLAARAAVHGDRDCISLADQRLTYQDLDARSRLWARGLLASGAGKGTRIGLLMPNGPDWAIAWAAATRIGAILVPLNTFYKPRELGWVLAHADIDTLLCVDSFLRNDYMERLERICPELASAGSSLELLQLEQLPYLRRVFVAGEPRSWAAPFTILEERASAISETLLAAVEAEVTPADPMVVIYSSGSTSEPKGAVHTHGAVIRHAENLNRFRDLRSDDRLYSPMPFFWVGGFVFNLVSVLHEGASVICEEVFEPEATLALLERERATIVTGWPHYEEALLSHPSYPDRDLTSVRDGTLLGLLPEDRRPSDRGLRAKTLGMTETCGPHTIDHTRGETLPERLRGCFGQALPGVHHKIVDPDTGEELGPDEFGEICVRGYSLMQGLYKQEREAVFDSEGYYHTQDGGHLTADGYLFFESRLGDMIKTAGANVAPAEVELVLQSLPGVRVAHVVGLPHAERGESVAAVVVEENGGTADLGSIREALRSELASYKVPRHLWVVDSGEVPLTDTGKVHKKQLRSALQGRIDAGDTGLPS